jgi:hypothetical protein
MAHRTLILTVALAATLASASIAAAGTVPIIVNPTTRPIIAAATSPTSSLIRLQLGTADAQNAPNMIQCELVIVPVSIDPLNGHLTRTGDEQRFPLTPGQTSWTGGEIIAPGQTLAAIVLVSENGCPRADGDRAGSGAVVIVPTFTGALPRLRVGRMLAV